MQEKTIIIIDDKSEKPVEPAPSPLVGQPVEPEPISPKPEEIIPNVVAQPLPMEEPIVSTKNPVPSRFVGKAIPFFFLNLGCFLLTIITLGIMFPWCLCWTARYEAAHTYVDGKPFFFDGRGSELIGKWLLYFLLFVITCGVFGLWIPKKIENWKMAHLHFSDPASSLI